MKTERQKHCLRVKSVSVRENKFMYHLRPHHLLCIQHYVGRGYDEAFTQHMDQVTESLRQHPDQLVQITAACDELCTACPNKEGDSCNSPDKVNNMDEAVRTLCKIQTGDVFTWEVVKDLAKKILLNGSFEKVCGNCNWYELCKSVQQKINAE